MRRNGSGTRAIPILVPPQNHGIVIKRPTGLFRNKDQHNGHGYRLDPFLEAALNRSRAILLHGF
ncbi:MAG: hypothetical protein A2Z81_03540 [Omnitrophica WOR_2 bacterium GWA2_45_18]|nr:MAG: hypothetical protein A2Z81_03540 [Omnitrophica WOR_2 bacterium GWA2_45_18]